MIKGLKIKRIITLFLIALVFISLFANGFGTVGRSKTAHKSLQEDLEPAWPGVGKAAIGSVEEGVLAQSSDNEKPAPIASMAKIITALAIMEKQPFRPGQDGQSYTVTIEDIANLNAYRAEGGSVLPILAGMKLTQNQAMQRMLIASDNCMADILVERIFGSMETYIAYARDMVKRMGLKQTIVADASGFSSATVSTPSELIVIGIAALKNPVIAKIAGLQQALVPVAGVITNTNQLLGTNGVIGIKTGTTDEAGSCLLFAARHIGKDNQKRTIVGVIMGDTNHRNLYSDSKKLLVSAKKLFNGTALPPKANVAGHTLTKKVRMSPEQ
jgi:serine-type D-Ala-D-Ala carboxypeptidase (penicillin-binding protein 5/6)